MSSSDDRRDLKKVLRDARSYAQQYLPELSRQLVHWRQTGLLPEVSGSVSMLKLADMLKVVDVHGAMQMAENLVKEGLFQRAKLEGAGRSFSAGKISFGSDALEDATWPNESIAIKVIAKEIDDAAPEDARGAPLP